MDAPSFTRALPMSELLPSLTGLLSKDEIKSLTARKQPRPATATTHTRTTEKNLRPLTLVEMRDSLRALKPMSPRRDGIQGQCPPSSKKKGWNSSVKLDYKKVNHTANGQMKNNPVRKMLNFQQPKPKNSRMTVHNNTETLKFPKPEARAKKSLLNVPAKNPARISGICDIPETPVIRKTNLMSRHVTVLNKENVPNNTKLVAPAPIKKVGAPTVPTPILKNPKIVPKVPITPMSSNSSWKSGSDASFLLKEKEINDIEAKIMAIDDEKMLENIAEISPPISTPFKEYRSIQEYFNNSSILENSAIYNENTIMSFDKPSICNDNGKKEESVIVSLCDLFNKATVTNAETIENTELDDLLEMQNQASQSIKMVESGIQLLSNIKESHMKSLQKIEKLIQEKSRGCPPSLGVTYADKTLVEDKGVTVKTPEGNTSPIISRPCSVIKSTRSPTYKIPKKNLGLRKKVICKTMSNVANIMTPVKDIEGEALSMYMKMKERMDFLSTPVVNRTMQVVDTPAVTSHNLQKQLDKLYNGS